jgi:antitoxin component of MazEF toxin-antitoxin module
MARRKLEDRAIRKLLKSNRGSYSVTLPIEIVRDLKWRNKQKVVVKKSGNKIIIENWKK